MSDQSSRQQHPEPDLLAGFAESSLTQHERETVLSHLAMCARCRQVVFLAHQVEPTPDTQNSNLKARPFWRRNWFPIMASASAVVALAVITFSWFGQFHKPTTPPDSAVAQQRNAPMPAASENASKTAEVAPPPAPAATMPDGKSAATRVRTDSKAQQALASPSPSAALNSAGSLGEEARRLTEEAQSDARRYQKEQQLNSASQKAQSAGVMRSAPGSNPGLEDKAGYSPRAMQSAKVSPQTRDAWDPPPSSGAATSRAYRRDWPAPAVESNQEPESKQVHGEGCVEPGVEAGCLMVKDRQSSNLYHLLIKGVRPQPGDGIEFMGVPHDGPTTCMQGIPMDVITWTDQSALQCAQTGTPRK
jgi:hypothetical protein